MAPRTRSQALHPATPQQNSGSIAWIYIHKKLSDLEEEGEIEDLVFSFAEDTATEFRVAVFEEGEFSWPEGQESVYADVAAHRSIDEELDDYSLVLRVEVFKIVSEKPRQ